ncbi:alkaline phosphatase family protein [Nocardia puris]|uniref:alkaline phosphatase family protein n=1 Tax=Nocardia puris TaxID=208602 RepID=UPI0018930769|nr:alkaline phosphatase family protein [Nocardia puris]MBF6210606.1 alkaline phosphatase family protein [Nocardia puris]MBF6369332.1 alkaline phosphatase family protein [Nocardia puris]MBF6457867.1 alkaline phosphatase family protein [Nocardia puris]
MFDAPRYGSGSLADLLPSVLAGLGVPDEIDRLGLGLSARRVCVLLIDGLGAEALAVNADVAPFLSSLPDHPLTAGFPSTTATSIASLGVGVPSGEHGIVGYLMRVPGYDHPVNSLAWQLHGDAAKRDLRTELVPEQFQPLPTAFERAARAGVSTAQVAPMLQAGSGLTRAVLRGCDFRPGFSVGDLVDGVTTALGAGERSLVYAYHADLDTTGHVRGPSSSAWRLELAHVDGIAASIAEHLPPDAALLVTADHGMVQLTGTVDFDTVPALSEGVDLLAGEPRARHVFTRDGATGEVAAAWRETLGADFAVLTRAEAIDLGWFGPTVTPTVAERIGDLVVAARGTRGVIRSGAEPLLSSMPGHHGSLTPAELNIPLRVHAA